MGNEICHIVFRESLPDNCPPTDAVNVAYDAIYRFLPSNPPEDSHFDSYAAKEKPRPEVVDLCRWSSCSFFLAKKTAIKLLPKLRGRFKFLACLKVPEGSGLSKEKKGHIDFWFFNTFDPLSAIVKTERI